MKIRTFWNILLKILGIYLVVRGLNIVSQSFSVLFYAEEEIIYYTIIAIGVAAAYFFILWLFVFKTTWLIDKLQLEKEFDEEKIELKDDFSAILSIAIIVIGGIMIVDSLPWLCSSIFSFYRNKKMFCPSSENPATAWLILYTIKTVIGYLLMTNSRPIAAFICRKNKEKDTE